jgi:TctA family transporter
MKNVTLVAIIGSALSLLLSLLLQLQLIDLSSLVRGMSSESTKWLFGIINVTMLLLSQGTLIAFLCVLYSRQQKS